MKAKSKTRAIAPVIIILILIIVAISIGALIYASGLLTPHEQTPEGSQTGIQINEIENYQDLLVLGNYIKYQWTSSFEEDTNSITIIFEDLGDEMVESFNCRKLSLSISDTDTNIINVWVLKEDWTTIKKLEMDGEEVPNEFIISYGSFIWFSLAMPYQLFFTLDISWEEVNSEVGILTKLSSGVIYYSDTALTVDKWQFIPNSLYQPLQELESVEIWQGRTGDYSIVSFFKVTQKNGDHVEFTLLELSLT